MAHPFDWRSDVPKRSPDTGVHPARPHQRHGTWPWQAQLLVMFFTTLLIVGCGNSDQLKTYHATGTIKFPNGKPLSGGAVVFVSDKHPVNASAAIQTDGSFELTTYDSGDGAVAGKHRVSIIPPDPEGDPDESIGPGLLHRRYFDVKTSELSFTVKDGGANEFEIIIERP